MSSLFRLKISIAQFYPDSSALCKQGNAMSAATSSCFVKLTKKVLIALSAGGGRIFFFQLVIFKLNFMRSELVAEQLLMFFTSC